MNKIFIRPLSDLRGKGEQLLVKTFVYLSVPCQIQEGAEVLLLQLFS